MTASAPGDTFVIMTTGVDDGTWGTVALIRTELADQLAALPEDAWDTPSLCAGWRVRDVVAHTTLPESFAAGPGGAVAGLVTLARARFSLARMIHDDAVARGSAPVPEVLAAFRAAVDARSTPPGRRPQHVLDDLYVHARDVRRPLGLDAPAGSATLDPAVVTVILATVADDRGLGVPRRVAGLRLVATDVDWARGAGPVVEGPAEALLLAMTGRSVALPDLSGDGLPVLAGRLR